MDTDMEQETDAGCAVDCPSLDSDSGKLEHSLEDTEPTDEHSTAASSSSQQAVMERQDTVFKVPVLPFVNSVLKPIKPKPTNVAVALESVVNASVISCKDDTVRTDDVVETTPSIGACDSPRDSNAAQKSPADSSGDSSVPYVAPEWSGLPSQSYTFEVLKGGVIVETVSLSSRPYTVCGRLASCDIVMEHPSVSRYHAVIQYRATAENKDAVGFYLYDLESTHGTQLNKCPVRPNSYYRLHVGHMIKFGGSSRTYILQGPPDDAEEESELTVTEIRERRKQEEEHLLKLQEDAKAKCEKEDEDEGIDWGMGDDAVEEDSFGVNPYSLTASSALSEELYINDPKKTLRGWFEREGYDLEYMVEEKGPAHFLCRVELPLDTPTGRPIYAEASVKGKKKEAVVACALEACRILDRHGDLRKSSRESRKRKKRNWEENDFYDSDEDTYLDQTGTIEKKRLQRIQRSGKDGHKAETYETLLEKYNKVLKETEEIEELLRKHKERAKKQDSEEVDSLDAYMLSIKNKETLDKKEITRLKIHLSQLKTEERKLQKLVNIAKPAMLPVIVTAYNYPTLKPPKKEKTAIPNDPIEADSTSNVTTTSTSQDADEDISKSEIQSPVITEHIQDSTNEVPVEDASVIQHSGTLAEQTRTTNESSEKGTLSALQTVLKRESADEPKKRKLKLKKFEYDSTNPNYAMWLPPDDQSGDGRTSLNEKYGY